MARKLKCPNCGTTKHVEDHSILKRVDGKYVEVAQGLICTECDLMFGHNNGYEEL